MGARGNAEIPAPKRAFASSEAYVRVAVLDKNGKVIPGFEFDKCVLKDQDAINIPLRWNDKSAKDLAGTRIRLRFQIRSANIYSVGSN